MSAFSGLTPGPTLRPPCWHLVVPHQPFTDSSPSHSRAADGMTLFCISKASHNTFYKVFDVRSTVIFMVTIYSGFLGNFWFQNHLCVLIHLLLGHIHLLASHLGATVGLSSWAAGQCAERQEVEGLGRLHGARDAEGPRGRGPTAQTHGAWEPAPCEEGGWAWQCVGPVVARGAWQGGLGVLCRTRGRGLWVRRREQRWPSQTDGGQRGGHGRSPGGRCLSWQCTWDGDGAPLFPANRLSIQQNRLVSLLLCLSWIVFLTCIICLH